jgi:hypothetical protein
MEALLTTRVKSCMRSFSISESFSTTLIKPVGSAWPNVDAMLAIIAALDCVAEPL